jgi:hypothetical protein
MSLIITHINRHGIIHASDSNLTSGDDKDAGHGQKTFDVDFLNAGLTIAGSYNVNGTHMDRWMPDFVDRQSQINDLTLEQFSNNLRDELEACMTKQEKESGSIIHIAGYVEDNNVFHPEFWFVRNVHRLDQKTGKYQDITDTFAISEDFWTRDYPNNNLKDIFQDSNYNSRQIYVNGFTPGRISFNVLREKLDEFFLGIWKVQDWDFRSPQSLDETELLVKIYMQVIDALFILSDYNVRYIGGDTQTKLIPQPDNIVDKK